MAVKLISEQNGWQIMLAEIGHLVSQIESGVGYVNPECLKNVTGIAELVAAVAKSDPSMCPQMGQIISALLSVADRFLYFFVYTIGLP